MNYNLKNLVLVNRLLRNNIIFLFVFLQNYLENKINEVDLKKHRSIYTPLQITNYGYGIWLRITDITLTLTVITNIIGK